MTAPSHRMRTRGYAAAFASIVALTTLAACSTEQGEDDTAPQAPETSTENTTDDASPQVTGSIELRGTRLEPLDKLQCGEVGGEARIQGMIGEGWINLAQDRATYEEGDTTWVSSSRDDLDSSLDVTVDGASGTVLVYEEGTAENSDEQEFSELVIDITCRN